MQLSKRFKMGAALVGALVIAGAIAAYPSVEKYLSYAPAIEYSATGSVLADGIGESVETVGVSAPVGIGSLVTQAKALLGKGILANAAGDGSASIEYAAHIQYQGWQDPVSDGATAGTTGEGLAVEAFTAELDGVDGSVEYRAHVASVGWQDPVSDGETAGTTGASLAVEAIGFLLTGGAEDDYDIWYRVHAQNVGWMGWAHNGEPAGTAGYGYRIEAFEVLLVAKGVGAPGSTANAFIESATPSVSSASSATMEYGEGNWIPYYKNGNLTYDTQMVVDGKVSFCLDFRDHVGWGQTYYSSVLNTSDALRWGLYYQYFYSADGEDYSRRTANILTQYCIWYEAGNYDNSSWSPDPDYDFWNEYGRAVNYYNANKDKYVAAGIKWTSGGYQAVATNLTVRVATGSLDLDKASAAPATDGNPMYSLAGTTYGVYTSEAAANARGDDYVHLFEMNAAGDTWSWTGLTAGSTYWIAELTAGTGYQLDTTVRKVKTAQGTNTVNLTDAPKRTDIRLLKTDGDGTPMANMPFMISLMSGNDVIEQHLVFTDANGVFDSSATYSYTAANANDYLVEGNTVPSQENKTVESRLWFAGGQEISSSSLAGHGALLFGTYKVEELQCPENTRYELADPVTFTVDEQHADIIDIGTFVNTEIRIVSTTATDSTTSSHAGSTSSEKIVDVVAYEGLIPGKTYTFIGGAYDVATGEAIVRDDDTALSCLVEIAATAATASGTLTMEYPLAGFDVAGKEIGISVSILRDNNVKAEHNVDLAVASQKVTYPGIGTTATDSNGTHQGLAGSSITINDAVAYENLDTSKTYKLRGVLHKIIQHAWYSGKAITGTATSATAFSSSGVAFAVKGDLYLNTATGGVYRCTVGGDAVTATWSYVDNITPAGAPTSATWYTGSAITHTAGMESPDTGIASPAAGDLYLNEKTGVVYICHTRIENNVVVAVSWEPVDKAAPAGVEDAGVMKSSGGSDVVVEKTFTPSAASGTEPMTFTFDNDNRNIGGVVVFEELYDAEGILVATHEDIFDEGQTVVYPSVSTVARDAVTSTHQGVYTADKATIIDTVTYENLTPGVQYTLIGSLMDTESGNPIGSPAITATATFTPKAPNGTAEMTFSNIPRVDLTGKVVVVYEQVYNGSDLIAEHVDRMDTDQYVAYPGIGTTALDAASNEHIGFAGNDPINIIDVVHYTGLLPGETYTLTGTAMNKATNRPLKNVSGQDAVVSKTFVADASGGDVALQFSLPASQNAFTAVIFEELGFESYLIAEHKDIDDEDQSVHYPGISTTAVDDDVKDHEGANDGTITIVDTVTYTNLIPGKSYTMTGALMNKVTGQVVKDDAGVDVVAEAAFTPNAADGTVDVMFEFAKADTENLTYVVYEALYVGSAKIAEHNDLTDEGQSVFFPKIRTTATDKDTQDHVGSIEEDEMTTLVDVVVYENLIEGHEYTMTGKLMNAKTGLPLMDGDIEITASKTFTAAASSGSVELEFTFKRSLVDAGSAIVAFEHLERNGYEIAVHADLTDENQTVWYPHISTTAKDKDLDLKIGKADGTITVTDTVAYDNLVPGLSYTLTATLWSKVDGELLVDDDVPVSGSTTFTPEEMEGTVDVDIIFPAELLPQGGILVAYEELTYSDKPVAEHKNPDDEGQTVYYPSIGTTAVDEVTGGHRGFSAGETITIIDTIAYENLLPGIEYAIETELHDKADGEVIASVVAEKDLVFVPEETSGEVKVHITATAEDALGKSVVVFEKFKVEDKVVAVHEDLTDEEQTVDYPKIGTHAVDSITNTHEGLAEGTVTIEDTVEYENLPAGDYVLVASLHYAETGGRVADGADDVSSKLEFSVEKPNGTEVMELSAPASAVDGKATVVFEELYDTDGNLIAVHKDLDDENQTVVYPHVHTTAQATDLVNGNSGNTVAANARIALSDTIIYRNLTVGETYTVVATMVVKSTGKPFQDSRGKTVEATATFNPDTADGEYTVSFPELNAHHMEGIEIVAFEQIYNGDALVAQHADINDAAQTVRFTATSDLADDLIMSTGSGFDVIGIVGTIVGAIAIGSGVLMYRTRRQRK